MAANHPSAHTIALSIAPLAPPQALMLARDVAQRLGWTVGHLSAHGLIAQNAHGVFEVPAQLTVRLYANAVEVQSQPRQPEQPGTPAEHQQHVETFGRAFLAALPAADAAGLQREFEQTRSSFVPPSQDVLAPRPTAQDWLRQLMPRRGYVVTPLLIIANVLVFALMTIRGVSPLLPTGPELLTWGANHGPLTLAGQWWRLLTSGFVHFGILHLGLNMYALLNIGLLLEPRIGPLRFLLAYLLALVGGGLGSLWWHDYVVSAGASGAIFGMYGVFLALLTTNLIEAEVRRPLLGSISAFVGYNLVFGLVGSIDNAAHIGGLLTGLLVGYGFYPGLRPGVPLLRQLLLAVALGLLLTAGAVAAYQRMPNRFARYQVIMQQIGQHEEQALQALKLPPSTPSAQLREALVTRGIPNWRQNLALLQRLDSIRLPDEAEQHNALLRRYTLLRLRSYQLMVRSLDENSAAYNDSIQAYNRQIEAALHSAEKQQ